MSRYPKKIKSIGSFDESAVRKNEEILFAKVQNYKSAVGTQIKWSLPVRDFEFFYFWTNFKKSGSQVQTYKYYLQMT